MDKVLHANAHTGGRDDWRTPAEVLERVRLLGSIGLDPCTSLDNPVGALRWCTLAGIWYRGPTGDPVCTETPNGGLGIDWGFLDARDTVFVNPPYSGCKAWAAHVASQADGNHRLVTLVAARPDTRWWRALTAPPDTLVAFWRGRLRFLDRAGVPADPAPFPSALVFHGFRCREVAAAMIGVADVWSPALG
jgi:hypothetical protein